MTRECRRAADVLGALTDGPERTLEHGELREHAATCASCRDLVTVVTALRADRDRLRQDAVVPSAGLVWWRAQLRRRQEAAQKATAPVTAVHAAAIVAAAVLVASLTLTLAPHLGLSALASWTPAMPSWAEASAAIATGSPALRYGLMFGATASLILGPVALYFAFRRD